MVQKEVRANILSNVKDWYCKQYETDVLCDNLDDDVTFNDIIFCLQHKGNFYDLIGVHDSLIRERIFQKLSKMCRLSYDRFYNLWLR